jgi:hypothetical protein
MELVVNCVLPKAPDVISILLDRLFSRNGSHGAEITGETLSQV